MSLEMSLLLGVTFTVLFGGGALLAVKMVKKKKQSQSVKNGAIGVQSGRDTRIGK